MKANAENLETAIAGGNASPDERRSSIAISGGRRRQPTADLAIRDPVAGNGVASCGKVRWVGAKGAEGVWQRIVSEMPPHTVFVEAFAGTGTITRAKRPAARTIVIDSDTAAPALKLPEVTALCGDALKLLPTLLPAMGPGWLIYCDPPYLASVRSCQRDYYAHEFKTTEQHRTLLLQLRNLPCNVMVSGYWSELYRQLLADWRTIEISSVNRRGGKTTEVVWCNFSEPFQFHDTRFLGRNFRERERIKRKRNRWKAKLAGLSRLDRAAVLDAIDELRNETSNPNTP